MKSVAIVGSGPGGLACASLLARHGGTGLQVTLVTGRGSVESRPPPPLSKKRKQQQALTTTPPLGLWPGSLRALAALDGLEGMERLGKYVMASGYRSRDGTWLARPSDLGRFSGKKKGDTPPPSLLFVNEGQLLNYLRSTLPPNVCVVEDNLMDFSNEGEGVTLHTESSTLQDVDVLVGADGKHSLVRKLLRRDRGEDDVQLVYRGYRVYRGVCPVALTEEAFQTWGNGIRFASVPLLKGQVWYAAVRMPPLADPHPVPMTNEGIKQLEMAVKGWHYPIDKLILSTPPETATVENAVSASMIPLMDLGRVALIGDAAHCLDPILALGASVAMEDAHVLASALLLRGSDSVPGTIQLVARQRRQRARVLASLSDVAQAVGDLNSHGFVSFRDAALRALPSAVKRAAFDGILRYVSTAPRIPLVGL